MKRTVDLCDFVRVFGMRLENNFAEWRGILQEAMRG